MEKKEKRLPNKVEGRGFIEIPPDANVIIQRKWYSKATQDPIFKTGIHSFSFTTKVDPDFMKMFPESTPWYNYNEKRDSEIANLKHKARQLLDHHYSVGKIVNEFGNSKFPVNSIIVCKCGERLEFVVDFFIHTIVNHGNSLSFAVSEFNRVLDKLANIEPW